LGFPRSTLVKLLVDVDTNEKEGEGAENTEDEDDTGLSVSPILALEEFVHSVLASGEEGGVNCGHFAWLRSKDCAERLVSRFG
jgi:hypothetical protein